MEDYNVEVTFTIGAESEEDAKDIVSRYLALAEEEVNLLYFPDRVNLLNFPDNIIGKAKAIKFSMIRTIATP